MIAPLIAALVWLSALGGPDYRAMIPPAIEAEAAPGVSSTNGAGLGLEPAMVELGGEPVPWALDLYDWGRLAQCESGGDWHIATGNGFWGGTQTHQATWVGHGGLEYAPRADLATVAEQVEVNRRILDSQGPNAWPACSRIIGWTRRGA